MNNHNIESPICILLKIILHLQIKLTNYTIRTFGGLCFIIFFLLFDNSLKKRLLGIMLFNKEEFSDNSLSTGTIFSSPTAHRAEGLLLMEILSSVCLSSVLISSPVIGQYG